MSIRTVIDFLPTELGRAEMSDVPGPTVQIRLSSLDPVDWYFRVYDWCAKRHDIWFKLIKLQPTLMVGEVHEFHQDMTHGIECSPEAQDIARALYELCRSDRGPGFRFHIRGKWSDKVKFHMTIHPPDDSGWAEVEDAGEDKIRDFASLLAKKGLRIRKYHIDPKWETIDGVVGSAKDA